MATFSPIANLFIYPFLANASLGLDQILGSRPGGIVMRNQILISTEKREDISFIMY